MNNQFKKILLKIAALCQSDQQWILNQLTEKQQQQFELMKGTPLLTQAHRFRKLTHQESVQVPQKSRLPALCHDLMEQDLLYIAIILEQGQFAWRDQFIESLQEGEAIHHLLNDQVKRIKADTKAHVFQHWQAQLEFDDQLVMHYG